MPSKAPNIRMREQEQKLLRYLYEYKVAHSRQLGRDIYSGITHQALYKRLNLLIRGRVLRASHHKELDGRLVYSLADGALRMLAERSDLQKLRRECQSAAPLHDLDLLDIGQRFRSLRSVTTYYPENLLKAGLVDEAVRELSLLRPDAVVKIQSVQGEVLLPIEYERTLKFAPRYEALFRKYDAHQGVAGVLFLGRDTDLIRTVKSLERKYLKGRSGKFFYSVLPESEALSEPIAFTNLRNESLILS